MLAFMEPFVFIKRGNFFLILSTFVLCWKRRVFVVVDVFLFFACCCLIQYKNINLPKPLFL